MILYEGDQSMKGSKTMVELASGLSCEYVELSYRKVDDEDFVIKIKKVDGEMDAEFE